MPIRFMLRKRYSSKLKKEKKKNLISAKWTEWFFFFVFFLNNQIWLHLTVLVNYVILPCLLMFLLFGMVCYRALLHCVHFSLLFTTKIRNGLYKKIPKRQYGQNHSFHPYLRPWIAKTVINECDGIPYFQIK